MTTPPNHSQTPTPSAGSGRWDAACRVLLGSGWILALVGGLTLAAWALGEPGYLQIVTALPPLHYNGGIGFLLWGLAHLALGAGRARPARGLALALGLLGVLALASYVPAAGIRLDRWAFPAETRPLRPGGIAPGLAVAFLLAAAATALASRSNSALASALVSGVGLVLVVVGLVSSSTAQASLLLPSFGRPSALGVAGAVIGGLGLAACLFRHGTPAFALGRAIPLAVGVAGVGLTFTLWSALNADQSQRIHRQVQFENAHVQQLAQERLSDVVHRFTLLSEAWLTDTPQRMKLEAGSYVAEVPGCIGVARLDPAGRVDWIESLSVQPRTLAEFGAAESLREAIRTGKTAAIRPPRSNWAGARVVLLFVPHRPAMNTGGLVAAMRLQELFNTFFNANLASGYAVSISEGAEPVFNRYSSDREYQETWGQTLPLAFHGLDWRLSVWPTREAFARESLSLPKLSLVIGLVMTALLALAVHLAQTARRRTAALEKEVRERQQAELAMRQSEEKYRTLIENLNQGIFLQDREHRFVAANTRFCQGVGRAEGEIVGTTEADLFDPRRAARHAEEVRTVLAEGKSVESEEEEVAAGKRTCVRRILTPVRDPSGRTTGVLGICWDVTEQRQLEAHVHQASKMDAIGQLAGGIAHDFNNLLTVMIGNLELVLARSADSPERNLVAAAHGAAERAAALTQRLLGFSRQHHLDWQPTNLNDLAAEVIALLKRTIDPLIRLEARLAADLWPVEGDPTQLNQVLMNLCLNARDAISGPGAITIETACLSADEVRWATGSVARVGEYVRLRVSDTGVGMTPEVKARIYEPFFTTKEVGKGTGLGLAMVFAIVRQHEGWIDCQSELGRGTRFDVYLPRGEAAGISAAAPMTVAAQQSGQGTILIADDEEMIRNLAAFTLQGGGYHVLQAADGQEAVDIYAAEKDRIDLVLLDLTMPLLSGHEAFRHMLQLNPRVRVLFASGYAAEQLTDLEKELMAGFVKKPYRPNDLIAAVEEALRRRPTEPTGLPSVPGKPAQSGAKTRNLFAPQGPAFVAQGGSPAD